MTKIFVYGTLLSGFGNNILLEGQNFLGPATTKPEFTFIDIGGFPGLMEGGKTAIKGEVYDVDDDCLVSLDRLEGCDPSNPNRGMYGQLQITLKDGREVITYRYNSRDRIYKEIESGDYRAHCASGRGRSYC